MCVQRLDVDRKIKDFKFYSSLSSIDSMDLKYSMDSFPFIDKIITRA